MSQTRQARSKVVDEARSWLGTPYHLNSAIKGVGIDCATLLLGVYSACGVIDAEVQHGETSQSWFLATDKEKYLFRALRHAHKTIEGVCYPSMEAKPGNAVLLRMKNSAVYNHGAIVTEWPKIIHAVAPCVVEIDITRDPMWAFHTVTVLDPWEKA